MTSEQDQQILLQARDFIKARQFQEARKKLRLIPNNAKAQEWLTKLDQIDPPPVKQTPSHAISQPPPAKNDMEILNRAMAHLHAGNHQAAWALLELIPNHPAAQELQARIVKHAQPVVVEEASPQPAAKARQSTGCGAFLLVILMLTGLCQLFIANSNTDGVWTANSYNSAKEALISTGAVGNNRTRLLFDCTDKQIAIAVLVDTKNTWEFTATNELVVSFDNGAERSYTFTRSVTDTVIRLPALLSSRVGSASKMTVSYIGAGDSVVTHTFNLTGLRAHWPPLDTAGCPLP